MEQQDFPQMTEFDRTVSSEPLQLLKAFLPYFSLPARRLLSLYAKTVEIQNTMSVFQQSSGDLSICSTQQRPAGGPVEMINSIRPFCGPKMRRMMDECSRMFAMVEMMEMMQQEEVDEDE